MEKLKSVKKKDESAGRAVCNKITQEPAQERPKQSTQQPPQHTRKRIQPSHPTRKQTQQPPSRTSNQRLSVELTKVPTQEPVKKSVDSLPVQESVGKQPAHEVEVGGTAIVDIIDRASHMLLKSIKQVWILRDFVQIELENFKEQQQRMNQSFDHMLKEMKSSCSLVEENLKNHTDLLQLYRHESNQEKRNDKLHSHKSI